VLFVVAEGEEGKKWEKERRQTIVGRLKREETRRLSTTGRRRYNVEWGFP